MSKKFHIPSSSDAHFEKPPRPGAKLVRFWSGGQVKKAAKGREGSAAEERTESKRFERREDGPMEKARGGSVKRVTGKQRDPGMAGAIKAPAGMPSAMPPPPVGGGMGIPSPMQGMGIVAPRPRPAMPGVGGGAPMVGALGMGRRPGGV